MGIENRGGKKDIPAAAPADVSLPAAGLEVLVEPDPDPSTTTTMLKGTRIKK